MLRLQYQKARCIKCKYSCSICIKTGFKMSCTYVCIAMLLTIKFKANKVLKAKFVTTICRHCSGWLYSCFVNFLKVSSAPNCWTCGFQTCMCMCMSRQQMWVRDRFVCILHVWSLSSLCVRAQAHPVVLYIACWSSGSDRFLCLLKSDLHDWLLYKRCSVCIISWACRADDHVNDAPHILHFGDSSPLWIR